MIPKQKGTIRGKIRSPDYWRGYLEAIDEIEESIFKIVEEIKVDLEELAKNEN